MNFRKLTLATAVALLSTAPDLQDAMADQRAALEEVVVTARKRAESALEVPESIATFSAGMIENANLRTLKDIGLMVPNLYMSTRLDGFPNVSMRGMGAFGNTQGVGFYLDDVQLFSDASSRFGDLERIEVLKGPQGVLYGGANIGGAIKFVSQRPDTEAVYGNAKLSAGEDSYYDIEGQVNIPLSDTWAMRLFGFGESYDGYLSNPNSVRTNGLQGNNNPDVGEMDRFGVRATFAGDITDKLSTFFTLRYNELDGPNNTWIRELDGDFEYGNTVDTSFNPRHDRTTFASSLELNYDMETVLATLITSHTDTDSDRQSDLDLDQEWVLDLLRPEDLQATTIEIRLSSTTESPVQWQVGAYSLDLERDLSSVLNIRGGFCFLDPGVCDPPPALDDGVVQVVAPFEVSLRKREQLAAFANVTYRLDRWEFDLGLRVDDWESKRKNMDTGLAGEESDTEVLGRGSVTWFSADQNSIVYGTITQGFEPGDLNLTNFTGENTLFGYDAENVTQYELGYKGQLMDGALSLTTAVFFIDYTDRQFELQATDPTGGFVEGIVNIGDSEQWGVEADLAMALAENWTGTLGFGYLNAEWNNGVISPVTGADLSGQEPPNSTEWSVTAALDYSRQLSNDMLLFGRLQVRYKGEAASNAQFFDAPGDAFTMWENPEFTVVDLNVGVAWQAWEFRLHLENVFDEDYYVDVQEFPNFAGAVLPGAPGSIVIGTLEQPRRALVSVSYEF
jgi:iron complex outermembrane receptor protein